MVPTTDKKALKALYTQIEAICAQFNEIRSEATGIVETSQMPDATLHLNDVLQATEEAANAILDAAIEIGNLAEDPSIKGELKEKITEQVSHIFAAASFQDLSGQRIKKVLTQLNALEGQLKRLSETAQGESSAPQKDSLLNGPALIAEAPSQADIDRMFSAS